MFRQILVMLAFAFVYACICCLAAGRFDWWRGWIYIGTTISGGFLMMTIAGKKNPEVLAARSKIQRGTKTFDKIFMAFYLPLLFAVPAVAGLDAVRFRWTSMPFWTVYAGLLLQVLAIGPILWAMSVNPFLENTVRIQTERGHTTISAGPYRYVRHPMYVGVILGMLAAPPILGSLWAFVPALAISALFVGRTSLEDRMLQRELTGYPAYAESTRYRLAPGLW